MQNQELADENQRLSHLACTKLNNIKNGLRRIDERWNNRLTLETLAIPKDYRNGRIRVLFELDGLPAEISDQSRAAYCLHVANGQASNLELFDFDCDLRQDDNNAPVLVRVVEFVNTVEHVIPSVGRLHLADEAGGYCGIKGVYLRRNGLFECFGIDRHREFGGHEGAVVSSAHYSYLSRNVVESGPQIMGDIAHHNVENFRRGEGVVPDTPAALPRVTLSPELSLISIEIGGNLAAHVCDVMVGPFNF